MNGGPRESLPSPPGKKLSLAEKARLDKVIKKVIADKARDE